MARVDGSVAGKEREVQSEKVGCLQKRHSHAANNLNTRSGGRDIHGQTHIHTYTGTRNRS